MDLDMFESQFRASENYKDIVNLLKNNYAFRYYKYYYYNTEHNSSKLDITLKILFNFINRYPKEDIHDLVVDGFTRVKTILKSIVDHPKDNKRLLEDVITAINNLLSPYINYSAPKKDVLTIDDHLDYEFRISSSMYKINHIGDILSYGVWREEYNYGRVSHSNVGKMIIYPYSVFMRIFLSKKFLFLRNNINTQIFRLLESADIDGKGDINISNKILKQIEIFINKHYMYLGGKFDVFYELRTYIENAFSDIISSGDKNSKYYNVDNLDEIQELQTILKAIDFWEDTVEDIVNRNMNKRIYNLKQLCMEEMK